jgi:hypothetical protein
MKLAATTLLFLACCACKACAASDLKRVLVTGFLPFNQYPINPSGDVARLLNGTCLVYHSDSICFDGFVLPVNVTGSSLVSLMIDNAVKGHGDFLYDAVVHMGLEDEAKGLRLETFALNQAVPDNTTFGTTLAAMCLNNSDYDQPTAPPAVDGAPCELPTTADLGRLSLEEALRSTGVSSAQRRAFILEGLLQPAAARGCCCCAASPFSQFVLSVVQKCGHLLLQRCVAATWENTFAFCSQQMQRKCCLQIICCYHSFAFWRSFPRSETLFRTLEAIRRLKFSTPSGRLLPAIFVHLPDYNALPQSDMVRLIQGLGAQMALLQ